MKSIQKAGLAILLSLSVAVYSCGPNDNEGTMDTSNSAGEGAIDSTRLTNFDSATTGNGNDSNVLK